MVRRVGEEMNGQKCANPGCNNESRSVRPNSTCSIKCHRKVWNTSNNVVLDKKRSCKVCGCVVDRKKSYCEPCKAEKRSEYDKKRVPRITDKKCKTCDVIIRAKNTYCHTCATIYKKRNYVASSSGLDLPIIKCACGCGKEFKKKNTRNSYAPGCSYITKLAKNKEIRLQNKITNEHKYEKILNQTADMITKRDMRIMEEIVRVSKLPNYNPRNPKELMNLDVFKR